MCRRRIRRREDGSGCIIPWKLGGRTRNMTLSFFSGLAGSHARRQTNLFKKTFLSTKKINKNKTQKIPLEWRSKNSTSIRTAEENVLIQVFLLYITNIRFKRFAFCVGIYKNNVYLRGLFFISAFFLFPPPIVSSLNSQNGSPSGSHFTYIPHNFLSLLSLSLHVWE